MIRFDPQGICPSILLSFGKCGDVRLDLIPYPRLPEHLPSLKRGNR